MCRLSICIPTYNRVRMLKECLDHLLPQVERNDEVEVIVSDNASSDNTESLVKGYMEYHHNLKYFKNQRNLDLDGNIIACIQHASGDYISFFSDDDIALPGTFKCVLDSIDNYRPSIICLSHYGFEGDDYLTKRRVFYPEVDKLFENGLEFFLFAGLGFISSLTLRTEYAKEFIRCVRMGKNSAHLDISSRIALKKPGPFLFVGTHPVAGRIPPIPHLGYDFLLNAFINVNQLYRELQKEGLLNPKIVHERECKLLKSLIPKYLLNQLVMGDWKTIDHKRKFIKKELGSHWQFYFYVYPIFFIPRQLLIVPYRIIHKLIRFLRVYLYN